MVTRLVFPSVHGTEGHAGQSVVAFPTRTVCVECLEWALLRQPSTSTAAFAARQATRRAGGGLPGRSVTANLFPAALSSAPSTRDGAWTRHVLWRAAQGGCSRRSSRCGPAHRGGDAGASCGVDARLGPAADDDLLGPYQHLLSKVHVAATQAGLAAADEHCESLRTLTTQGIHLICFPPGEGAER